MAIHNREAQLQKKIQETEASFYCISLNEMVHHFSSSGKIYNFS